jgi:hypothetical protein
MKQLTYKEVLSEDIFDLMGAPKSMSDDEKQALILKLYHVIENRVIARILDKLDESEIKEFDSKMIEDKESAFNFLKLKGIDFNKLIFEESIILKTELAELAKNHGIKN